MGMPYGYAVWVCRMGLPCGGRKIYKQGEIKISIEI